ncbi:MAG: ABC transporter substrate-binding protein, partial [Dehalococcoidales bacterium]
MKNRRFLPTLGLILLALIVAALPVISACSPDNKEPTLKIGMMTPSTGAAAEKGAPMGHANLDAIKYINDELGGVGGYKIEVLWLDSAYEANKAVTNVKRFMDEG